jgi:hypothetical protein
VYIEENVPQTYREREAFKVCQSILHFLKGLPSQEKSFYYSPTAGTISKPNLLEERK